MNIKLLLFKIKEHCLSYSVILKMNKLLNNVIYYKIYHHRVVVTNRLSIFDYYELAKPTKRYYSDYVPENNDKNMGRCLKEYMGVNVNFSINAMIEHGLFFGNYVADREFILKVPTIITFGDQRINHLKEKNINKAILPIGPYIHYAKNIFEPEEFENLKKKLGRVLLVFPSHSLYSEGIKSIYNIKEFTDEIDRIAKDFDTVLVSLHYNDTSLAKDYERKGYKCVTSGHTNDPLFMHRQRSIIELSDATMSNAVGTHVGYCVYLNKPHYIFKQLINNTQNDIFKSLENKWVDETVRDKEVEEVENAFGVYSTEISLSQKSIVDKYWGIRYIKTPEELKSLLTFSKV